MAVVVVAVEEEEEEEAIMMEELVRLAMRICDHKAVLWVILAIRIHVSPAPFKITPPINPRTVVSIDSGAHNVK